jgi:hypothetical protein
MTTTHQMLGLFDELEKLAKAAKKEEERKKVEMVPAKKPPIPARIMGGMMGAAIAADKVPYLARKFQGKGTFYHGTSPEAAYGILGSGGIDPSFAGAGRVGAGAGDKAARINRHLMADSLNRMLESHGVPMTHEEMAGITDQFNKLMDVHGMKAHEAAQHITQGITDNLVQSGKLAPEAATSIHKKLGPELSRYGHRVYAATSPAAAIDWAGGHSEGAMVREHMLGRMSKKQSLLGQQGRALAEGLTFGLPSKVEEIRHDLQYKPSTVEHMPLAQLQEEMGRIRDAGGGHQINLGFEAPTGQMGFMEDFPAAKHVLGLNPGMKHSLQDIGFKTYEPGRDISFPHLIPKQNIKHVDIVDPTTRAIRRIHVSDAVKAEATPILKRMKGVAAPLALAGLGGYGMYRAIKPRKRMVPKGSPMAEKEKQGTVASDMWGAAKYVLPVAAVSTGIGLGAGKLADKIVPSEPGADGASEFLKQRGRLGVGALLSMLGSGAAGAAGAAALGPRKIPLGIRTMLGGAGGAMFGSMPALGAVGGREISKTPEVDPMSSFLPEKAQDTLRKHPWIGGVRDAAISTALPLAGLYAFRKYYPGTYSRFRTKHIPEVLNSFR